MRIFTRGWKGLRVFAGLLVTLAGSASAAGNGWESRIDAAIDPNELGGWMKNMSSQPNQVGSSHDRQNAEYELKLFRSWGWDVHIERFEALYPTPVTVRLAMPAADGQMVEATLREPPVPGDPSSAEMSGALPAYLAYQSDGDVSAPVVYVNYGVPEDYETLERMGVSVAGRIVLARYGQGWRGVKVKLAQDHGAIGAIIYSDPADDGYALGAAYPKGPARPPTGIQRGSVIDLPKQPGDPTTPGYGSVEGVRHLPSGTSGVIMKIPALPISYGDARVLLEAIGGRPAPAAWRGALPLTYRIGQTSGAAHLVVESDWSLKPLFDVIATLRGSTRPDEWVLRGNHRDGWVFGATDPLAGQVALMGEAKALGSLYRAGWRPARTIIYCSWDGEEAGLLGSTEWAETHADELRRKAVLYVNSDGNERGVLRPSGSPEFQRLVNAVAAEVTDPETSVSVLTRAKARVSVDATLPGASEDTKASASAIAGPGRDLPLAPMGAGSDYSVFLQHLGIASLDLRYGGEGDYSGVYHSAYDDFAYHERFVDPGFQYAGALAKTGARVILRTADAELFPQRYGDLAEAIGRYVAELKTLIVNRRVQFETRTRLEASNAYALASDPLMPTREISPIPLAEVDITVLTTASARLEASATAFDAALSSKGLALAPSIRDRLSRLTQGIDQTLLDPSGLPSRPWYRNLVYAPGRLTGYGVKTLPGVREAIEEGRSRDAALYASATAAALNRYADQLDVGTRLIDGAK